MTFTSPCSGLGCTLQLWPDPTLLGIWYQHNDNLEHRLFVSERELMESPAGAPLLKWLEDIHSYEECDLP